MTASPARQPANLLGALALAVSDRMAEEMADRSGHSDTAAAALSALDEFLGQPSIELLARVVGLSHSGTVRLVDRLERDGLVRRRSGLDRRATNVSLTAAGRRAARRIQKSRLEALDAILDPLSNSERATFTVLAGRILVGMMREPDATRWICRLCDLSACGRPDGHCPIEHEARSRYGTTAS